MKKLLFATMVTFVSSLAILNEANAQSRINENSKIIIPVEDGKNSPEAISPLAVQNFEKRYNPVSDLRWFKVEDGVFCNFISGGVKNTIFYDTRGIWAGSIKRYTEDKLPTEVWHIAKDNYKAYSIFDVEEVETIESEGIPTYIVHLENKRDVKLIRIYNGEMVGVWKEFQKG